MGSPRSHAHVRDRLSRVSGSSGSTQPAEQEPSSPTLVTGGDHAIAAPAAERASRDGAEETRATRGVLGAPRTRRFFGAWDGRARRAVLVLIGGLGAVLVWWWVSGQPSSVTTIETDDSSHAVDAVFATVYDEPVEQFRGVGHELRRRGMSMRRLLAGSTIDVGSSTYRVL